MVPTADDGVGVGERSKQRVAARQMQMQMLGGGGRVDLFVYQDISLLTLSPV